ncbi:hypothetical protein CDD83_4518 [Cordyceps sp. RAO-2017]|nr:hypothetical protein CDD83_4518 [Cordyceps sp. RAO-2017]
MVYPEHLQPEWDTVELKWLPLRYAAERTILTKSMVVPPPLHGPNASYSTTFHGPYLVCRESSRNVSIDRDFPSLTRFSFRAIFDVFQLNFNFPINQTRQSPTGRPKETEPANFFAVTYHDFKDFGITFDSGTTLTTYSTVAGEASSFNKGKFRAIAVQRVLRCNPAQAIFNAYHVYTNNIGRVQVSVDRSTISPLPVTAQNATLDGNLFHAQGLTNMTTQTPMEPKNHEEFVKLVLQSNLLTLIKHMGEALSGTLSADLISSQAPNRLPDRIPDGANWRQDKFGYYPFMSYLAKSLTKVDVFGAPSTAASVR